MNGWIAFSVCSALVIGVGLLVRFWLDRIGSDDHDLESKLAAALEDELCGAPEGWRAGE